MTGKKLYSQYTALRDFSGSPQDEYAQLLQTIQSVIQNEIFPLLERAESEDKKLSITEDEAFEFAPEITVDSIILV